MTIIIGIDPHKATHTAVAIDETEQPLAQFQLAADRCQTMRLLAWAAPFEDRAWAVESADGLGKLLSSSSSPRANTSSTCPPPWPPREGPSARLDQGIEERPQRCAVDRHRRAPTLRAAPSRGRRPRHQSEPRLPGGTGIRPHDGAGGHPDHQDRLPLRRARSSAPEVPHHRGPRPRPRRRRHSPSGLSSPTTGRLTHPDTNRSTRYEPTGTVGDPPRRQPPQRVTDQGMGTQSSKTESISSPALRCCSATVWL